MIQPNERTILLGLINEIEIMASTRRIADDDHILTVEELHANAQEKLDRIAAECALVLLSYDRSALTSMSKEWAAWRDANRNNEVKAPNE